MTDEKLAELVGFLAAHAVWSVEDGETLVPMLGTEGPDETRQLARLAGEELTECVQRGRTLLQENSKGAARAVLLYDGYITVESGRTDAILIEARDYRWNRGFSMAVPYRHASNGFAVFRPKLLAFDGDNPDFARLKESFFVGIDRHEEGARFWSAHIDESC